MKVKEPNAAAAGTGTNTTATSVTTIDDAPEVASEKKVDAIAVPDIGNNMSGDRLDVTLHQGEGEAGSQAVFIGLNGQGFNMPRGIRVSVPAEVVHILENAEQTVYDTTKGKTVERQIKRFSYTVHGPSPKAKK